nr:Pc-fam-2 protein [uncultured Mediterranean phage uvMED]
MNNLKKYAGLLNEEAPKDHFLAYITPSERDMLVDAGGVKTPTPSGIFAYPPEGQYGSSGTGSYDGGSTGMGVGGGENTPSGDKSPAAGGSGDNSGSNQNNFVPTNSYDEAGIVTGNVDAEDEYLAPDNDHFKATQKAIKKTNKELRDQGLDKSEWSDWTKTEQETYQKEMNNLKGTEGVNYSFYKGNEGTTNLSFNEHWKDVAATNPNIAKFSPVMRFLVAAGRTLKENLTTDYGTGRYGGYTGDGMGSGQPIDKGGWLGRIFNSDGTVNENLTESETNDLYNQAQAELPFIIGDTTPQESMVNKYFDNLGNNLGMSSAYLTTYNDAKNKIAQTLNLTPNTQQFGFGNTFNNNYARSMTTANPFFEELTNQGLI